MADEQPSRFLAHLINFTLRPLAIDCLTKEPVTGESINTPKEMNYHDRVFSICSLICWAFSTSIIHAKVLV